MDLRKPIETVWASEQPSGLCERLAFGALTAASAIYGAGALVRSVSFDIGVNKATSVNSPVFSIGNLTVGGTGKTPMVMEVARILQEAQRRVAILTRGYHRKDSSRIVVLNSGNSVAGDVGDAGDEASMMARLMPDVPVVIGANRRRGAQVAERDCGADALILDDGFQHRWLARDCDIVLWDTMRKAETLRLLPRGPLREGIGSLARAQALVFTRTNLGYSTRRIIGSIKRRAPQLVIFHTGLEVDSLEALSPEWDALSPENLAGKHVAAFCGIGNPDSFWKLICTAGAELVHTHAFADHYRPREDELEAFVDHARQHGAEAVLLTGKDRQNLPQGWRPSLPTYILHSRITWGDDRERFRQFILQYLDKPGRPRSGS